MADVGTEYGRLFMGLMIGCVSYASIGVYVIISSFAVEVYVCALAYLLQTRCYIQSTIMSFDNMRVLLFTNAVCAI